MNLDQATAVYLSTEVLPQVPMPDIVEMLEYGDWHYNSGRLTRTITGVNERTQGICLLIEANIRVAS